MSIVLANPYKLTLLGLKLATLNGGAMGLIQNDPTPWDGTTTLGAGATQFHEATFSGYARQALTGVFGTPFLNGSDQGQSNGSLVTFTMTGVATTNNIYGYFIVDNAGNLICSERNSAAPVAMNAAGLLYTVLPQFIEDTL
jgi:hypothetical protein